MQLNWSDIWVLQALNQCIKDAELDIVEVIAVADGIQHAILTSEEFNNAIHRLEISGLIEIKNKAVIVTKSAKSLFEKHSNKSIINQAKSLEKELSATGYTSEYNPNILVAPKEFLSKGRFNSAIQKYQRKYGI